jgi:hypothetical protein
MEQIIQKTYFKGISIMNYNYKISLSALTLGLLSLMGSVNATEVKLVAKPVTQFDWIYDDHNTSADDSVSIWRPNLSNARFADGAYFC